jgi:hypothetical protein
VDNFFHNIINEPIAISLEKMHEISKLINARAQSTNISLFPFITLFADKIDELEEAEENFKEACIHYQDQAAEELQMCNVKVSLCISVLVNFFYPMIEQLEKIVEDGIMLEKDLG